MSMPNGEFRFKPKYITLCYFSLGCTVLISIVLKRQAVLVLFVRLDEVRLCKQADREVYLFC